MRHQRGINISWQGFNRKSRLHDLTDHLSSRTVDQDAVVDENG